jgi:hypothetical protein
MMESIGKRKREEQAEQEDANKGKKIYFREVRGRFV